MRVFISHSSLDKEVTAILINLLRQALNLGSGDIRCTSVDGFRLPAGVSTNEALRQEVYEAGIVIGLITPNSMGSAYVLFELGARWGAEKAMIPLLASGIKPEHLEGPLRDINALDCSNESQVHQFLKEAAGHLDIEPDSAPSYINTVKTLVEAASKDLAIEAHKSPQNKEQAVQSFSADPDIPPISKEAMCLLIGGSNDRDRMVRKVSTAGGTRIMTRKTEFTEANPRSEALWEAALEQLVEHRLLEDSGDGVAFKITDQGFRVADWLKSAGSSE